jgi:predicted nucleic acid-binding protein
VIILDTNVLSEFMNKTGDMRVRSWIENNEGNLALSVVVIAEIAYGIERIRPAERSEKLEIAFKDIRERYADHILPFDDLSALVYGKITGSASRRGRQITMADGLIAATALRYNSAIATRNIRHFANLGIELFNPWN